MLSPERAALAAEPSRGRGREGGRVVCNQWEESAQRELSHHSLTLSLSLSLSLHRPPRPAAPPVSLWSGLELSCPSVVVATPPPLPRRPRPRPTPTPRRTPRIWRSRGRVRTSTLTGRRRKTVSKKKKSLKGDPLESWKMQEHIKIMTF